MLSTKEILLTKPQQCPFAKQAMRNKSHVFRPPVVLLILFLLLLHSLSSLLLRCYELRGYTAHPKLQDSPTFSPASLHTVNSFSNFYLMYMFGLSFVGICTRTYAYLSIFFLCLLARAHVLFDRTLPLSHHSLTLYTRSRLPFLFSFDLDFVWLSVRRSLSVFLCLCISTFCL